MLRLDNLKRAHSQNGRSHLPHPYAHTHRHRQTHIRIQTLRTYTRTATRPSFAALAANMPFRSRSRLGSAIWPFVFHTHRTFVSSRAVRSVLPLHGMRRKPRRPHDPVESARVFILAPAVLQSFRTSLYRPYTLTIALRKWGEFVTLLQRAISLGTWNSTES